MRIVVAPSGFKERLEADEVADRIEAGVLRVIPEAEVLKAPMVDGGEGFTKALVAATEGVLREIEVTGPVGDPVGSHYGFLGGDGPKTAMLEMADDGAGADQSLIDRAFDPTDYEDGGRPRTGLTLTKAVVEQHGGRFGIESEPGEGTYAQIRLPLRG